MSETQTLEIINVLKSLPSEKIVEVKDFAIFLRERYGKEIIIDENDEWTDEDLKDFSSATFSNFNDDQDEDSK